MTTIIVANPETGTRVLLVRVNSLYAAGYEPAFDEVPPGETRQVLLNGTYGEQVEVLVGAPVNSGATPVNTEPVTALPETPGTEVTEVTDAGTSEDRVTE